MEPVKLGEDLALRLLAKDLARAVKAYYADPAHRKEFEEWYLKQYGVPYKWKTGADYHATNTGEQTPV